MLRSQVFITASRKVNWDFHLKLQQFIIVISKGLVTNYGERRATKRERGAHEVLPLRKGGAEKVLDMLKGGGAQQVLG